ncbi:MAG: PrsW family glutamic-type intramembrane protease [Candidatus Pacebacteria bacterium]|nr:PrsW family glutamic-type intramembrane protease [Candidatus Paceibacterota bacterium]
MALNNIYVLYLLGFLPSFVWLLFYLRKDRHPESNKTVIKIFVYGMLSAVTAIFLEKQYLFIHNFLNSRNTGLSIAFLVLSGAVIEETVKYSAAWLGVFRNKELDEPFDVMLYLIISALGFAALENILVLAKFNPLLTTFRALEISSWRFASATFLHALCSGTLGYWAAVSFCRRTRKRFYIIVGLGISVGLHALYNWSIMKMPGAGKLFLPLVILIVLGVLTGYWFKKLKKMKSVCVIR